MRVKIHAKDYRVSQGSAVDLGKWPTLVKPAYGSEEEYTKVLAKHIRKLSHLQSLHYASNRSALLLIFQGMDAAGKDGTIKHVMSGLNPQGCRVYSFKHPTPEELEHDFLWRTTRDLPERGQIGIFNRSYYEDVLIARVHPEILKGESLQSGLRRSPKRDKLWKERYRSINELEAHLHRNGTQTLKFFLHLSKKEQKKRFLARIDDPAKNWKLSQSDIEERKFWAGYAKVYAECLAHTSTRDSPWFVVPADDKLNCRLIVSQILREVMESFHMEFPHADRRRLKELRSIRRQLERSP